METLKFKTTINCTGCISKVTPFLNEALGEDTWKVDVQNPEKVLTVESNEEVDPSKVVTVLQGVGFKAERIG